MRRYRKLYRELGQWQRSAGLHARTIELAEKESGIVGCWDTSEFREAQDNVERIRRQILTIETPQARVVSD